MPTLQSQLASWSQRCADALADLGAQVEAVKKGAVEREKQRRKKERALEAVMGALEEKSGAGKKYGEDDVMDIDMEGGTGGRITRGMKRGAGNAFSNLGRRLG